MILAVTSAGGATVTVVRNSLGRRIPGQTEKIVSTLPVRARKTEPDKAGVLVALGSARR